MNGMRKLKKLFFIMLNKLDSKFDAIIKEAGGPKTTQQKNAIKKSAIININNLFTLGSFLRYLPKFLLLMTQPQLINKLISMLFEIACFVYNTLIDKCCIMFNIFKKKSTNEKTVDKNRGFEINLIGSVLAYEVARSDGAVSEDELRNLMKQIDNISINFKKNSKEIFELIETHSNDSVSFYEFVKDINNNFSKDEKLDLIKYLWDIAYADNILDVNEERLIRRISDLIQIKDIEVLKLKDKARN